MNSAQLSCRVDEAVNHVAHVLPQLNTDCRDGRTSLSAWISNMRPLVANIASTIAGANRDAQLKLQQVLGIILASAERHSQAQGGHPGSIVQHLPDLEESLISCSGEQRVPVLTAELYWERNSSHPALSFTGEQHELFFISAVRTQAALRAVVNRQLRGLIDGAWNPSSAEGAHMLRTATAAMKEARGQYLDFRRGPDDQPLMTPAQFNEMRSWLPSTAIGGRALVGANAAHISDMVVTDFLIGTANEAYRCYVSGITPYQSPEGRLMVAQDAERRSLILLLAAALGLSEELLDDTTVSDVSARIRVARPALSWTLEAFKDFMGEYIGSSGVHIGLINIYLEKYAQQLTTEELDQMPVKPTEGTGGHSHDHTRQLHDMRRKSPRIRKVLAALKEAFPSTVP